MTNKYDPGNTGLFGPNEILRRLGSSLNGETSRQETLQGEFPVQGQAMEQAGVNAVSGESSPNTTRRPRGGEGSYSTSQRDVGFPSWTTAEQCPNVVQIGPAHQPRSHRTVTRVLSGWQVQTRKANQRTSPLAPVAEGKGIVESAQTAVVVPPVRSK